MSVLKNTVLAAYGQGGLQGFELLRQDINEMLERCNGSLNQYLEETLFFFHSFYIEIREEAVVSQSLSN